MIGVIFQFGTEHVEVRVLGTEVFFRTTNSPNFSDIGGLKLDWAGVVREFPDLKHEENWKSIAQERFKVAIKKLPTEEQRIKYVMEDLIKYGYKPLYIQKKGFRPQKI